jgi:AraC family transcriptional regulator
MRVEVIEREPTTIAYLRRVGPYGEPLSVFWQTQVYPWMVGGGLLQQPRYGISHDEPNITAAELCRYDAGCEIPIPPARATIRRPAYSTANCVSL